VFCINGHCLWNVWEYFFYTGGECNVIHEHMSTLLWFIFIARIPVSTKASFSLLGRHRLLCEYSSKQSCIDNSPLVPPLSPSYSVYQVRHFNPISFSLQPHSLRHGSTSLGQSTKYEAIINHLLVCIIKLQTNVWFLLSFYFQNCQWVCLNRSISRRPWRTY
jgi:hypothetical protein